MKNFFLGFNWKANPKNLKSVESLISQYLKFGKRDFSNTKIVIFTPEVVIGKVYLEFSSFANLFLGVQDLYHHESGAFTGETPPELLKDFHVKYALIGHSETRKNKHLSNEVIHKKIFKALMNEIIPVVCLGYEEAENLSGKVNYPELETQIKSAFTGLENFGEGYQKDIIVAYEPIWAIGSSKPADNSVISSVFDFIDKNLKQILPLRLYQNCKLVYGGSVNQENFSTFLAIPQLKGLLIGGASLDSEKFSSIIQQI